MMTSTPAIAGENGTKGRRGRYNTLIGSEVSRAIYKVFFCRIATRMLRMDGRSPKEFGLDDASEISFYCVYNNGDTVVGQFTLDKAYLIIPLPQSPSAISVIRCVIG